MKAVNMLAEKKELISNVAHGAVALGQVDVKTLDDAVKIVLEMLRVELARQFHRT